MVTNLAAMAMAVLGPMVGVEFAVAAVLHPITGRLPDDGFRSVRSESARLLGKVMPFWYIASFVLLVAAGVTTRSRLIGAAAALLVVVIVTTVAVLVPINNRIAAWSAPGDVSRDLAARWDRLHALRAAVLVVIWVLLAMG